MERPIISTLSESTSMQTGVSVVVCCHNSSERLVPTLSHLALQDVSPEIGWEVVIVDNASFDNTRQVAEANWLCKSGAKLRVVHEPRLGLGNARERGVQEARYSIVSLVDDDNWVCTHWVQRVWEIMAGHPGVGACGGPALAAFSYTPPPWFESQKHQYAIGVQADSRGEITWTRGWLWGAGLSIRKLAWQQLRDAGFRPLLIDRHGEDLSTGGDVELCLALRLAGWKLWYEPSLILEHYLPTHRLTWHYLRRLVRANGRASVAYDPYIFAASIDPDRLKGRWGLIWTWRTRDIWRKILRHPRTLQAALRGAVEGELDALSVEGELARLFELLRWHCVYDHSIEDVWMADWRIAPGQVGWGIESGHF